jgi:hypothetical protein
MRNFDPATLFKLFVPSTALNWLSCHLALPVIIIFQLMAHRKHGNRAAIFDLEQSHIA